MRRSSIPGIRTIFSSGFSFGSPPCSKEFHADWVLLRAISWKIPPSFIPCWFAAHCFSWSFYRIKVCIQKWGTLQWNVSETWEKEICNFEVQQWYQKLAISNIFHKQNLKITIKTKQTLQIQVSLQIFCNAFNWSHNAIYVYTESLCLKICTVALDAWQLGIFCWMLWIIPLDAQ